MAEEFDCDNAIKAAKLLDNYAQEGRGTLLAILCNDASHLLLQAVAIISTQDKEVELPTSPGYWWGYDVDGISEGWKMYKVREPLWVDPSRHDLNWYYADGSGGYPLKAGRWIKVAEPVG